MRGIDSSANAFTPAAVSRSTPALSVSGCKKAISTWPLRSRAVSSAVGVATFATTSAPQGSPICAPASVYAVSGNAAAAPAPASTITSTPSPSRDTVAGTSATRRSPSLISFGIPSRIRRATLSETAAPTLHPRDGPADLVRARPALRVDRCGVGGCATPRRDRADRRRDPRGARALLDRLGDRRRRGGSCHRRQHRLLDRSHGWACAARALGAGPAVRGAGAPPGRALLRKARRQDRLHRSLRRGAPCHRGVARGHHAHVVVAVLPLERHCVRNR